MVHKNVNSSLPGPLSMSNGLKYVRFWLRFRHIPEQNNILKISIKFARQNIPCQKMFPLPNTCGPLPNRCGPLPNSCGPLPITCGLLTNTCGPLPNICGPLPNTCGPLLNTCGQLFNSVKKFYIVIGFMSHLGLCRSGFCRSALCPRRVYHMTFGLMSFDLLSECRCTVLMMYHDS